jgi:glycerophosphoryl diester phosphodiesterase
MKKILKMFLRVVLLVILIFLVIQLIPAAKVIEDNPFTKASYGRPLIIAHGGSKDLFPENTMTAFDGSMAIGVDMLEIDVCLTKDNVLITHHNLTIDDMTNGTGYVRDYTLVELKAFNFGYGFKSLEGNHSYRDDFVPVTTLEMVFQKYPDILYNVELKDKDENGKEAAKALLSLIEKYEMEDRILVPSFSDESINYFREISHGQILTSSAREETKRFIYMHLAQVDNLDRNLKFQSMQLPTEDSGVNLATKAIINDAKKRNIAIHYWTIDDPDTMKKLIEMGVDGIITDRPDIMNEVLRELGY